MITNACGAGIIVADALEESGVIIARFSNSLIAKFSEYKAKKLLLPVQSEFNPIDLSTEATSDMFALAIATILDDPAIGGLVLITLHHAPMVFDDAADKIAGTIPKCGKLVIVCDIARRS